MTDELFRHVVQARLNGQKISEIYRNGQRIYPTKLLPDGFELLEYIQGASNNANQNWINTNILPTRDVNMTLIFMPVSTKMYQRVIGYGGYFHSELNNDDIQLYGGSTGNAAFAGANVELNEKYNLSINGSRIELNGLTIGAVPTTNYSPNQPIAIGHNTFGTYRDHDTLMRIYSVTIYNSGILVSRLLPCRKLDTNQIGMYDIIRGYFVPNAGAGQFIAGPRA